MKMNRFILLLLIFFTTSICYSQEKKSIKETIVKTNYNDINSAISHYKKLKKETPNEYNFEDENELNNLGYQFLKDNRKEDALKIFELLVSEFPNSFNAYDSFAEAYFVNGNKELAVKNYKKSLELNPKNENAERFIVNVNYESRDKNKFKNVYTKQQYLEDLDELANTLTSVNPHPYKFMPKEDFWRVVEEKKKMITATTTYSEFIWHCSELVANINCGHSSIPMYFMQESEMLPANLRFPMELYNINGKLYVADALINKKMVNSGTEIRSINGKSSTEIIKDINKHISSQGNVGNAVKRHLFNGQSTAMLPYAFGFPKKYEIVIKGKKKPLVLNMLETYQFQSKKSKFL
jgi:tetratricopeptide (TPR) repeat protein